MSETKIKSEKMPTIGILGGGQLARMLALSAANLGIDSKISDQDASAPAALLCGFKTNSYEAINDLKDFFSRCNAITFEFENIPLIALSALAGDVSIFPPVRALEISRDRVLEKTFAASLGIPAPKWVSAESFSDLLQKKGDLFFPAVLKTTKGGYDGKGQWRLFSRNDLENLVLKHPDASFPVILEEFIEFDHEYSCIGVRSISGETRFYSVCENVHKDGTLLETVSPPRDLPEHRQRELECHTKNLLNALSYVGTIAVEFFSKGEQFFFNEFAPRVHNTGHWTIEGAVTSQFENHVRACLDLPLGSTEARGYSLMLNLLGTTGKQEKILATPGANYHWYGKEEVKEKRKVGHVTYVAKDQKEREQMLSKLKDLVT